MFHCPMCNFSIPTTDPDRALLEVGEHFRIFHPISKTTTTLSNVHILYIFYLTLISLIV